MNVPFICLLALCQMQHKCSFFLSEIKCGFMWWCCSDTLRDTRSRECSSGLTVAGGAVGARVGADAGWEHHGGGAVDGAGARLGASRYTAAPALARAGRAPPRPAPRRTPTAPRSTLNRRIKNFNFFVRIRFFFRPLVNFFRGISPLFRLPEMIFFRFRRTDRARCVFKSCLIFLGKGRRVC